MKSSSIRESFIKFFQEKQHKAVSSSSLVPIDDPTLLFTNAGMNQFKDYFLRLDTPNFNRAVTSQKCVRAGGKHNDLENVGYTARHHTFFEMLGNFSFGDYFKREALSFAWEFLTSPKWLNLPAQKLLVTVYAEDDEAYNIWAHEIGVATDRIIKIGDKGTKYVSDNFWTMGETGPCGPCSEIFYDHGENVAGGPPGSKDEDGDRFIEIWNCVFMQFNRTNDGQMQLLPKPSVDTGMGLERISAVLQNVHSNYEIDLFKNLLTDCALIIDCANDDNPSLKVVADHIRACSFLIADGVTPSNEGRGYVLRRIIRRACRHGNKLGAKDTFFYKLVTSVVREMGDAYQELVTQQTYIEKIIQAEEQQFAKTLEQGLQILAQDLKQIKGNVLSGDIAFKLYDTYGFPLDLTADIAREKNLTVNEVEFEQCMEQQRQRARSASNFKHNTNLQLDVVTEFCGYDKFQAGSSIVAIFKDNQLVNELTAGESGIIVLDNTPFYAESGGQVGDKGIITNNKNTFVVNDTQKHNLAYLHYGTVKQGTFVINFQIKAQIDIDKRTQTARNHSAAHLLHEALRRVLGTHVQQKGSHVNHERLRLDISHFERITSDQIKQIEDMVNQQIWANTAIQTEVTDIDSAKAKGAIALFGEKYGKTVRLLSIGDNFSNELCGGTHAKRTGDLGLFKIISETSIASGVRRIEAVTAINALNLYRTAEAQINQAAQTLKVTQSQANSKVMQLLEQNHALSTEIGKLKNSKVKANVDDLLKQSVLVGNINVLATKIMDADNKALLGLGDQLKNKLKNSVIVLASISNDKVIVCAFVSSNLTTQIKAGDLVKQVCSIIDGKGGGRADIAQGGGTNVAKLDEALKAVQQYVSKK